MNFKNIFFSYSRADASDFALRLALDLQKEGFNVWIDQQDIRAGSEWDLEIGKALETCDCLLFIESEKSVASTNVLDEVYYAIDQHKMVIPVILKDSKTPFRLNRLQHIDFTKNYETGLANLIHELENRTLTEFAEPLTEKEVKPVKPFYEKSGNLITIALLIIIAAISIYYFLNNKRELNKTSVIIKSNDTLTTEPDSVLAEAIVNPKKALPETEKRNENKIQIQRNDKKEITKPVEAINLKGTFAGRWQLAAVEPGAKSYRGYLSIEEAGENKFKILSSFQFYFIKTNDTAFFSVFNGFAGCNSCVLQNEITIIDYDVAFGTQTYKTLKKTQPGAGNAGDTILNAGSNTSIRASVILHLENKNMVIIKVQKPVATPISRGFVVEPFIYTFRFTKDEY